MLAKQNKSEKSLIASASIENGKLVIWTCEPKRYEVAVAEIPELAMMSLEALAELRISASGSRLHWDDGDVDLSAESICALADPAVRKGYEAMRRKEAVRYAHAIRAVREEYGLRQTDIPGLTSRQLRRLEEGDTIPHSATLKKLAAAHGISVDAYLKKLARTSGLSAKVAGGRKRVARKGSVRGSLPAKKSLVRKKSF